ncbi:hypothetical protein Tco_0246919 [Tanacetum coccineum]
MYKEYLAKFWYSAKALENSKVYFLTPTCGIYGEVGVNTFRNAIGAHYLLTLASTKPRAKPRHKKLSTFSKQPLVSSKEATKGGSSKAPTSSKTGHSRKIKEFSSAMDSNPCQPPVSTSSFIIHSESASGNDASVVSTAEADPGNSATSDFIPQQQRMNEGTKNTSCDHLFLGTGLHVLINQTKSVSEGLETILTQPITGKGVSSIARQVEEEESSNTIKLEDLAKLVSHVQPRFKDLDSPKDDHVIVVDDSDEDEETEKDEVHPTPNAEIEDNSVPKSSSPRSSQIQVLSQPSTHSSSLKKLNLNLRKNKVKLKLPPSPLKAQIPPFPNVVLAHISYW